MVEEEHTVETDLFVYTRFYYTVEEEHTIQTDLFVYIRFYYTVKEEHAIQTDLFTLDCTTRLRKSMCLRRFLGLY